MSLLSWLFGCRDSNQSKSQEIQPYAQTDVYKGMRGKVLGLTPEMISLPASTDPLVVIMETGYPEAVSTLVCIADGSASIYFSTGGGVIGGGGHESVRLAAMSMLKRAESVSDQLEKTKDYPLPQRDSVRFYIVGRGEVRTIEVIEMEIANEDHLLYPMWNAGQAVVARIREVTEEKE